MGAARWNPSDWQTSSAVRATKSTDQIFTSRGLDPSLDPTQFTIRESRDSSHNPNATPLIVALDVTGSMGILADHLVKKGLGELVEGIIDQQPIVDPHILIMGIGDAECDDGPIQATQFEADNVIEKQIEKIWLEHGGGGNQHESYDLAWHFAATRCQTDHWDKRQKKGYLFTVGDEPPPHILRAQQLQRFMGATQAVDIPAQKSYDEASKRWEIFHIVIAEGDYPRHYGVDNVVAQWADVVGKQRVIKLEDHTKLPETIIKYLGTTQT